MARKTREQQIAYYKERIKKLQQAEKKAARKARNHRLIASAATIESESGIELDEYLSRILGKYLRTLAEKDAAIAGYLEQRRAEDDAREADVRGQDRDLRHEDGRVGNDHKGVPASQDQGPRQG